MHFEPAMSLTEQIADHLGADIIAGRLLPQARIQELKVASELGVSRGSVREALLILERRHLVEILPRRGAMVSHLTADDMVNCSELICELQVALFTKLAAKRGRVVSGLESVIQEMAAAVQAQDLEGVLRARQAFIEGAAGQLNNFYLGSVLSGLGPAGLRVTFLAARQPDYDLRDNLRYHQALLKSLGEGDTDQLRQLVQAFNGRELKLALCAWNEGDVRGSRSDTGGRVESVPQRH